MRQRISPAARLLLDLLARKSDFASGRVWYGRAVGYAKIASWFGPQSSDRPSLRSLQRWMAELRHAGKITVRLERMNQGMRVTITSPVAISSAPRQMTLFSEPVEMPVNKPVETARNAPKQCSTGPAKFGGSVPPFLAEERSTSQRAIQQAKARAPALAASTAEENQCKDRKPWSPAERRQKLDELYRLKRALERMTLRNPRFDELRVKYQLLEDDLGRAARSLPLEDTG